MKILLLSLVCLLTFNLYANDESFNLLIDGNESEESFFLNSVEMDTLYRQEVRPKTCYRREFAGYNQVCYPESVVYCSTYSGHGPRPGHGPHCVTRIETRCSSQPMYRDVAYTCNETVSVPYKVFKQYISAEVKVSIKNKIPKADIPSYKCDANFAQREQYLEIQASCPDYVVLLTEKKTTGVKRGDTLHLTHTVKLDLLDQDVVYAPKEVGIKNLKLTGQVLSFETAKIDSRASFKLNLSAERKRLLKKDQDIINRDLLSNEYTVQSLNSERNLIKIDLKSLVGGIDRKKKHEFVVKILLIDDAAKSVNNYLPSYLMFEKITVND